MKRYKKWFSINIIVCLLFIISGCHPGGSGSSSGGSSSSSSEITVGIDPNLTAIHSQNFSKSSNSLNLTPLSVSNAIGTMQVTDTSDSSVTNFDWPITYDDVAFTLTSNKTIVLSPGVYNFSFLVTIGNHQYAGSANAVTINDGTGTDIPLTVNAVIGDTNITVDVVSELPEFKFSYSTSELSSLTTPKIGIIIDSGSETIFDLDPSTGISNQFASISAGPHTIELKLYDDATQVGKSVGAQESVTVVAGEDIPMNLIPLSGQAAVTLIEEGGDATFNFTVPNEVVNEAGGASNLDIIFKMSGANNNPADVTLSTLVDNGDGTSSTAHTHTGMQQEDVNLSLEFFDNTTSDLLGSCTMVGVTLDVNGSSVICSIDLVRRAIIQGSILATVGVNVYDTDNNPIAGAIVSESSNTLGLTNSGSFGTPGFLEFNLQAGIYTIQAESGGLIGTTALTVSSLDVTNIDITLDTPIATPKAYVANFDSNTVSVIDTDSNTVTDTVTVGTKPVSIAITPDGNFAYVANFNSNTVSVIDTASNTVTTTVTVGSTPFGVAITPDGNFAYVANFNSNTVSVIATATNTVTATVPISTGPVSVAITPDGNFAYVTNNSSSNVSVIATTTNTVVTTVPIGTGPDGIAITSDGNFAYVTNNSSGTVSVIATATNTVTDTVTVGGSPRSVTITPDGEFVYVANSLLNTVSVIATATNTVTATVTVGAAPLGVAITPDGEFVYVGNQGSTIVSVIATATNTVTATVTVGASPTGVAITP